MYRIDVLEFNDILSVDWLQDDNALLLFHKIMIKTIRVKFALIITYIPSRC